MSNYLIHKSNTRGNSNHGWLDSKHTFSFADYYDPERIHFGALRVLNDDIVEAGKGFGMHPHDNMEIISIPLEGELEHKDSMGNISVIKNGEVQVMSAGSGIFHSEFNKNKDKQVKFLQIWVYPNKKNVIPRYDQITVNTGDNKNKLNQILSPNLNDEGVWIHQNAWFNLGKFDKNFSIDYKLKDNKNGVYIFILNGEVEINNIKLSNRDGLGVWNFEKLNILSETDSEILFMEVPMILV